MNWIDRVIHAMEGDLDPTKFERTACALLQAQYPGLSPVEGGTDLGRDADVYDPSAVPAKVRGRLLATVGDPAKNLATGLSRLEEEGLRADYLVIASARPISAKLRLRLEARAEAAGFGTPHIFGRDKFVPLLARSPEWAEYFLGITGRISALSTDPASFHDDASTLVGRDGLLETLEQHLATDVDVILSGAPGVGKSRVVAELAELGGDVAFVEPFGVEHLVADLMLMEPRCVVVDDAHLHADVLARVLLARRQQRMSFSVVAVTWPAEISVVRDVLPSAVLLEVGLLRRSDMDSIVQARGVRSVRARQLVLDQADGRPGWAVTLASTLVAGGGRDVATGATLLDQVLRHLQTNADSAATVDAIACVAALGHADLDDLAKLAALVSLPTATLVSSLRRLATDGLLTLESGRWRLQPGLGSALAARWFFGEASMRPWDSLVHAFPERHADLTSSIFAAAGVADSAALKQRIICWVRDLPAPSEWDLETCLLVMDYSGLGADAASFAAKSALAILGVIREPEISPWGTERDPLGDVARQQLKRCVHQWFDAHAVEGLLSLSLSDNRPRHNATDHPMRILADMTGHLGPDGVSYFDTRVQLLDIATDWYRTDPDARSIVWAEAVALVFAPEISGTWHDPASFSTITMADAYELPERLGQLVLIWDRVDDILARQVEPLPSQAVDHLFQLWQRWMKLAGGLTFRRSTPSQEHSDVGQSGAQRIYASLFPHLTNSPGISLRTQRALDRAAKWGVDPTTGQPPIELDPDLVLLVSRRDSIDAEVEDWLHYRETQAGQLADRLNALEPVAGVRRFLELEREAQVVGGGSAIWFVGRFLVQRTENPTEWLDAAIRNDSVTLLGYFLPEAIRRGHLIDHQAIGALLDVAHCRATVVSAALEGGATDLAVRVLESLTASDAAAIENALLYREAADDLVHALLTHQVDEIAAATACCFQMGTEHGMSLPLGWEHAWRGAFLRGAREHSRNTLIAYREVEILKQLAATDPDTCVAWFTRLLDADDVSGFDLEDLYEVAETLPRAARLEVARAVGESKRAAYDLLPYLCGDDRSLVAELLGDGLDEYALLTALNDHRDSRGLAIAAELVTHGVVTSRVATHLGTSMSWMGKESDELARVITWFSEVRERVPELSRVAELALARLHSDREEALAKEEREAIRGFA